MRPQRRLSRRSLSLPRSRCCPSHRPNRQLMATPRSVARPKEQLRSGEDADAGVSVVSHGPEAAPGAHALHLFCGAVRTCVMWGGRVALVEAKMNDGEQEGVVGDVGSAVLEILVGWDGQRCSAVSAPSKR
jgi:hypothetical protein